MLTKAQLEQMAHLQSYRKEQASLALWTVAAILSLLALLLLVL